MTVQDPVDQGGGWRALLESAPLPALRVTAGGVVVAVNGAWEVLSGLDERASMGTGWAGVVVTGDRLREELAEAVVARASGSCDHQICIHHGEPSWCRWWWRPTTDAALVVGVASIEADKAREQRLWFRATHDPLTGLTNRAEFLAVVARALHRGRRRHRPPAVIYIDLHGFKAVNDDGGHHLGDQVLRSVAQRLSDVVRPADVAARIGGDEFAVVCEDLPSPADAEHLAARIRSAVELSVSVADRTLDVRATTGIAFAAADDDPVSLLSRADLDMYANRHRMVPSPSKTRPVAAITSPARRPSSTQDSSDLARNACAGPEDPLALADWLVNRVFEIGLGLHIAASAEGGHRSELVNGVAENLDRLIADVRLGALDARRREHDLAIDPENQITQAREALDDAPDRNRPPERDDVVGPNAGSTAVNRECGADDRQRVADDRGDAVGRGHRFEEGFAVGAHLALNSSAIVVMGIGALKARWPHMSEADRASIVDRVHHHAHAVDETLRRFIAGGPA